MNVSNNNEKMRRISPKGKLKQSEEYYQRKVMVYLSSKVLIYDLAE